MRDKIVVFGAGATGRGHVGLLAWQAGAELVFVERRAELVETLRRAGRYRVRLHGGAAPQEVEVTGLRVYHTSQRDAILAEVVGSIAVLTAVFDQNLPEVADLLAPAAAACRLAGRTSPLNCIACENMMDSSSTLGRHVRGRLNGEDLRYHEEHFGYPDCMISRVVPVPEPDALLIVTEDYNEWTARAAGFCGAKPAPLASLELVENQTARLERKLFIHNGGHAVCGFIGWLRGHRYIHEAVADPVVAAHVLGALDELGEVVRCRHGFSAESIATYKADLPRRGAVAELHDEISRVVRDPIRKLSPRERLLAPALLAVELGLPRRWIVKGIVAALKTYNPADPQSVLLAQKIASQGLRAVLAEVCQLDPDCVLVDEICKEACAWNIN